MINITKLYCGKQSESDALRYGGQGSQAKTACARKPVVVWTMSRGCNLHCVHCYTDSEDRTYPGEMTVDESKRMIDDLAAFGIPALLMSGGEPLRHPHFFALAAYAVSRGLNITISTNGTLIDAQMAQRIKDIGVRYVGVSFDGLGKVNDQFRGQRGAFDAALAGIRHLRAVDQKMGLRFTITRRNYASMSDIFDFVEREEINRVCFYHLVYSGRGKKISHDDLSHAETRQAVDLILQRTRAQIARGRQLEVLTVDNHVDGVYLYKRLLQEDPERAAEVRTLLEWNGGGAHSTGVGIGNIDAQGNVHPDQFWQDHNLGNVRDRPFSEIWTDPDEPLLVGLRNRLPLLQGRCKECTWQKMCGGSFRVRALRVHHDPWAADPGCYLTTEELHEGSSTSVTQTT
jgi:Fe-coproporphyrin III synthase